MGGTPGRSVAAFVRRNRVDVALVCLVFALLAPIVAEEAAQPASRIDLTAAIVEHHGVDISHYPIGVDYSIYHGIRSDKPPGQAVLAVPAYAVERALGAQSVMHRRQAKNLTLWWVTLWTATIPFAALLVIMRRTAARYAPRTALAATVALGFGTLLLPFAINLYGHVLEGLLGFSAWSLLSKGDASRKRLAVVGLLAGLAVCVEYEAIVIAVVLLAYAALRFQRSAWWYVAGALPPALALATYQWLAFGAPWATPYPTYVGNLAGTQRTGFRLPFSHIGQLLWNPQRGLLVIVPLVVLAVYCAGATLRDGRREVRDQAFVALAVFIGYVLVVASSQATNVREIPGPRFILASFPFLVVPLAVMWPRVRIPAIATACWGASVMMIATVSNVLVGDNDPLIHAYSERLRDHQFLPTLWSMTLGYTGTVLRWLVVGAALCFLVWAARRERPVTPGSDPVHMFEKVGAVR
jgi:hypothetical protein